MRPVAEFSNGNVEHRKRRADGESPGIQRTNDWPRSAQMANQSVWPLASTSRVRASVPTATGPGAKGRKSSLQEPWAQVITAGAGVLRHESCARKTTR